MKFIGHILALLLAAALSATVTLWSLSLTLGNASYIEGVAQNTKLYDAISAVVPGSSVLQISDQVHASLPQIIRYIVKGGPAPSVDFGSGPVQLGPADPKLTTTVQNIGTIGTFLPVGVIVLVVLIVAITGRSRLAVLARSAFEAAVGVGISAAAIWLAPSLLINLLGRPETLLLKAPLTPFLEALFHGIATQLATAALLLLAISVILRVLHGAGRLRARFMPRRNKPPLGTEQSNIGNRPPN